MGWVARCIRGGISPPHPDPWTVRRCTTSDVPAVYGTPDGGSGAALGTKSLEISFSLSVPLSRASHRREIPPASFYLLLSLSRIRGSQGELLKLYCRALKRRKRRKNNMTLLPSAEAKGEKLYTRLESGCVVVVVVVSFAVFRQHTEPSPGTRPENSRQFSRDL